MNIGIPRCRKTRWAEGNTVVCSAQLSLINRQRPKGMDPDLQSFLCPICGDYYWIHASALPLGLSSTIDAYWYYHEGGLRD